MMLSLLPYISYLWKEGKPTLENRRNIASVFKIRLYLLREVQVR